ncbi:MAG: hypothetical protein FWG77_03565 [Treponema sp.]|nr:hypothetical protein [Treponema sp.]
MASSMEYSMENPVELLRLLPNVLRARESHLYLEGGKRLVDLYLDGGRAVLGHKPPMVLRDLKNAAERGLNTGFPHPTERRFLKGLQEIFPDKTFRIYKDKSTLAMALEQAGIKEGPAIWRPFTEENSEEGLPAVRPPVILPILPCPLGPPVLVLDKTLDASFSPGDLIPPVLLAPAIRALYNLISAIKQAKEANKGPRFYQKVEISLRSSPWQRNGIYLRLKTSIEPGKYKELFQYFLEGGFLIPPSIKEPIILPLSMSLGEETKLAELLKKEPNR